MQWTEPHQKMVLVIERGKNSMLERNNVWRCFKEKEIMDKFHRMWYKRDAKSSKRNYIL